MLQTGESVVINGTDRLRDGAKATVGSLDHPEMSKGHDAEVVEPGGRHLALPQDQQQERGRRSSQ